MDELWLSSKNMKAIAFILMIAAPLAVGAEVSPIRLRVEQVSKDTHGKFDHKQEKSLKVELSNSSADELGGVKVSYFYFAREVKSGDLAQVGKGEMTAQVKAHGSTMLETPGVSISYTEAHTEGNPFANRGKSGNKQQAAHVKTVAASGRRFYGYGVRVSRGGEVVAEYFSEPSLKAKVGG